MIIVDINLLLYAVITGFPQHKKAQAWWEETLNKPNKIGLAAPAIFGFLRLSTNLRVLSSPLRVEEAIAYVNEWLEQPNVVFLTESPTQLEIAFKLLHDSGTAGNLTADAQLAAMAIEHDAELYSNDTDFGRFAELKWINPLR